MSLARRNTTTPTEAFAVTGMAFGMFIISSIYAVANGFPSKPFSDGAIVWMVGTELMLAASALGFLYLRGFDVASLFPSPSLKGTLAGIALFFVAALISQIVVAPFSLGQPQQPIEIMVTEARVSVPALVALAMINGTFEEVFLQGFLLRGLRGYGLSVAVSVTLLVRALCHLYQGPLGPLWVMVIGFTFTIYYMRSGQLWPPVFAHMLWDIVPFMDV